MRNYKPPVKDANQLMIAFSKSETIEQNCPPDRSLFSRFLFDAGVDLIDLEYDLESIQILFSILDRNSEDDSDQNFILCRFLVAISELQDHLKLINKFYLKFLGNINIDGYEFGIVFDQARRKLEEPVI